jgi:hypothetical protein
VSELQGEDYYRATGGVTSCGIKCYLPGLRTMIPSCTL